MSLKTFSLFILFFAQLSFADHEIYDEYYDQKSGWSFPICRSLALDGAQRVALAQLVSRKAVPMGMVKRRLISAQSDLRAVITDENSVLADATRLMKRRTALQNQMNEHLADFWQSFYFEVLGPTQRAPAYRCARLLERLTQILL